ncbi:PilZ domain-containing protein [Roseomonas fluvialis]|nr:PilZ domain-containing protein [Roseomonas fluvialis]
MDRRRTHRQPMCCGARLEFAGRAWSVNLLDLSEGGAGVQALPDIVAVGAEGHLIIDTAVAPVRVISVAPDRVGLAFVRLTPHIAFAIASISAHTAQDRRALEPVSQN